MKRCQICNSTYAGDDEFCHNDGSRLVADSSDTPTVVLPTPGRPTGYATPPTQGSSGAKWMVPAIGVLCGLVVVLGFFAFYKQSPDSGEKNSAKGTSSDRPSSSQTPSPTPTPMATMTPVAPPPPPPPTEGRVVQVNSPNDGFLALKSDPCVAPCGRSLLKIPHGTRLSLGTCKDYYEVADRKRGKWCYVSYGGRTGWIFDGFVDY